MRAFIYLLVGLVFSSCSEEASTFTYNGEVKSSIFNTDISKPVTTGNWYKPSLDVSWQWQLKNTINKNYSVELYDIDLFDSDATLIKSLQDDGKKVICYFSAGSYENWREDADSFSSSTLGKILDGWEDEKWLDIRDESLAPIMRARLDLAVQKGCDGVEPDNMDGYINDTSFSLTYSDQAAYNKFIANEARGRGLSVALKNDLDQIVELEPYFDFSVNEQCHEFDECDSLEPFINADKPVLNAEYSDKYINSSSEKEKMCSQAQASQFRTLILPLDLDDTFRISCD